MRGDRRWPSSSADLYVGFSDLAERRKIEEAIPVMTSYSEIMILCALFAGSQHRADLPLPH